jgi:hypothetical protein
VVVVVAVAAAAAAAASCLEYLHFDIKCRSVLKDLIYY